MIRKTVVNRDDRGAVAVLVALCLLVLIGFAAIAVDSGIAYGDRRQQQSAADVGALAALQFARTTDPASHPDCTGLTGKDLSACRGAEEALAVVDGTLPGRYDDAAWNDCDDPDDDTLGYTQDSFISDCISFTSDLRRSRVRLPGTDVDTSFGAVLGIDTINVGAFAEAGLEMTLSGGVIPFALGPSAAGSNQACFMAQDNAPTLDVDPCDGHDSGNFGKLDIRWYGNELYNLGGPICHGQLPERFARNVIVGTDHPLEIHTWNPGVVNDVTNCDNIANPVDEIETWTGNDAGPIEDGFINGADGLEGRLMCKDGDPAEDYPAFDYTSSSTYDCVSLHNMHPEALDHTPLWEFLAWFNGPCNGSINDRADMAACLAHYNTVSPGVPLFNEDIVTSPRFGGVPELHADPGNGQGAYLITAFTPVYLETLFFNCDGFTCAMVHSPGEDSDGSPPASCPATITPTDTSCGWPTFIPADKDIEAVTAFVLTLDMLPGDVAENFPFQPGTIVYNLYR